jgi:phospholipid transport system substrate-binding protein
MQRVARYVTLVVVVALALPAWAGAPTDQLKRATEQILQVLDNPQLRGPAKTEARRAEIRAIANQVFDWQEMAKRALGRHWTERTPEEREEFAKLFGDLLERSYVGKLDSYDGERILYVGEAAEGPSATVRSKVITKSNAEVPVDYRLLKNGDHWRVYDITIEGVSLVGNYRMQFNRVIAQSGYAGLVQRLKTKQDDLAGAKATH